MASIAEAQRVLSIRTHPHLQVSALLRRRGLIVLFLALITVFSLLLWSQPSLEYAELPIVLLEDWPRPTVALTSLGLEAEEAYHLGSLSPSEYRSFLRSFINVAFPWHLKQSLIHSLDVFLDFDSNAPRPEIPRIIWQTDDVLPQSRTTHNWRSLNEEHQYRFLNDDDADDWVRHTFKGSAIEWAWDFMPHPVMKADLLRYLLLLMKGGIYSDVDTVCLKPISRWGFEPDFKGQTTVGPPSAIVGIEADVGEPPRPDWHKWWSRPIQIAQWTMAFSPGHPALLDTVRRVYAIQYQEKLRSQHRHDSQPLINMTLEWTGPAVFTDAMLRYSYLESGLKWPDLRGLKKPLRTGSVTFLPVTGFSPGMGNFGSEQRYSTQAMVYHQFRGSWKPRKGRGQ